MADGLQSTKRTRWSGKAAAARPWGLLASLMASEAKCLAPLTADEEKNRTHVMK